MRCPSCGNDHCHIVEEAETREKGYGFLRGICGYIILGPIGILCGMCGMGSSEKSRRAFWVCDQCGKKFRI